MLNGAETMQALAVGDDPQCSEEVRS